MQDNKKHIEKITKKELETFNRIIEMEKKIVDTIMSSSDDIYNVYYNNDMVIILFKNGKTITKEYLDNLQKIIDYKDYSITIATVTEQFFKIKYTEEVLQINITL